MKTIDIVLVEEYADYLKNADKMMDMIQMVMYFHRKWISEYIRTLIWNRKSIVLINSKVQMITEKLKSMIRFGTRSTRYKDVFDICYLSDFVDRNQLQQCIEKYILSDVTLGVTTVDEVKKRAERLFTNSTYKKQVERSRENWLDMSVEEVLKKDLEFIQEI